ncbi:hypothetical protein N7G274_010339 [Stereocaulon virgatum]|uniref:TPR-like protein n=1 Tax=Stereocaulon virgatum TaxID=373712 RepID=A0ABR3ZTS0_9LECA
MAPFLNGYSNGNRHLPTEPPTTDVRFSDIPSALDIQVSGGDDGEAVEISLEDLLDDPTELCTLLENENAEKRVWMIIALAYARQGKVDLAVDILHKGLNSLSRGSAKEKLGPLGLLCWMFLGKSRHAPRVLPEGQLASEVRTKDYWLQAATGILNEAARINPSFPPLYLARGVLYLLRASLHPPSKPVAPGAIDHSERVESLKQALKCFEDAARVSSGRNMMAVMGTARAHFSLGKYAEALKGYQEILSKMPHLQDPDPRIGIGCCLWQLGYREEARESWERALELNPESKVATILLGLYYLNESSNFSTKDPAFGPLFKKAMTEYTQKAFKLDKDLPLTCATFGGYFLLRRTWGTVETLARKAIELTDVNAIASDGWYLLARKEHSQDPPDFSKVVDYYGKADAARGGGDRGYVPARFGLAQVQVLQQDVDGAKFRLEKIIQTSKSIEAMMLLGALNAEEVFANQANGFKEDKSAEIKKAIALLEAVRMAWRDPQKKLQPDLSVVVYLARLYEADQPDKAMQCLQQVEKLSIEDLQEKRHMPKDVEIDEATMTKLREELPPQLLNNLGCFHYQAEKYDLARDLFQTALNALVKFGERDETIDTDALVTTISYNLARTYEAASLLDDAKTVYEGLLARHDDYTDARTRLAYIELRQNPTEDGPRAIAALSETDSSDLEVRALLGWYLSRSKKRATNVAEDQEQRHYKHTLQLHEKHDRYSLTGMGNAYSTYAREMRRTTEKEKEKRSAEYLKAVGYYDKALQLDPKNAYAAQGIGIALVEDKKDLTSAVQIFSKIKDTVRDSSVYVNLGHVFCELKQYSRSIESYEAALHKDRASDPQVLACLGRVYLLKGKQDKNITAMKSSLDYSRRALAIAPSQIHFKFNIAFVQIQLAQLMYTLPESQRTLVDVQSASDGLDDAIESFTEIAKSPNPPYPKHDIEQRANMGRNTMRRQLERAIQSQREFEEKNANKLLEAREAREAENKKREEQRIIAEEVAAEEKKKIAEERYKMLETSRKLAEKRAEEERRKEEAEYTEDSETGERVKRKKKSRAGAGKRKKKGEDSDTDAEEERPRRKRAPKSATDSSAVTSMDEGTKSKKRRKLARKAAKEDKFKSSEMVVDSDADEGDVQVSKGNGTKDEEDEDEDEDTAMDDADPTTRLTANNEDEEEEEEDAITRPRKKAVRRIEESDDEDKDEDQDEEEDHTPPAPTTTTTTAERAAGEDPEANAFADADVSMVDESVGAAGGADGGGLGVEVAEAYGEGKEDLGTGDRQ